MSEKTPQFAENALNMKQNELLTLSNVTQEWSTIIKETGRKFSIDISTLEKMESRLMQHLTEIIKAKKNVELGVSKQRLDHAAMKFIQQYPEEYIEELTEAHKNSPKADFNRFLETLIPSLGLGGGE